MTRCFSVLLSVFMLLYAVPALAADEISLTINGAVQELSPKPAFFKERVFVPVVPVFERLDATVTYDKKSKLVTIERDGMYSVLTIGGETAEVNDQQTNLSSPSRLINNQPYVPYTFIASALDLIVKWDDVRKTIVVLDYREGDFEEAPLVSSLNTTMKASAISFKGLNDGLEFTNVMDILKESGAKATFFITQDDIKQFPDQLKTIISMGHSLGILAKNYSSFDFKRHLRNTFYIRETLKDDFGYDCRIMLQESGSKSPAIAQAATALNLDLLGYDTRFTDVSIKDLTDPEEIFTKANAGFSELRRGQHVLMAFSHFSDTSVLSNVLSTLLTKHNIYSIITYGQLASDTEYKFNYPVMEADYAEGVAGKISLNKVQTPNLLQYIQNNVIGSHTYEHIKALPGFSKEEAALMNTTGRIQNKTNTIFLTFDDWGSDGTINKLLNVLNKHNVKATFFVITSKASSNPNLLRQIALEGHDIASHSDTHMILSNNRNGVYSELSSTQIESLNKDLVSSYKKLLSVVGDITYNGKPVLTNFFRPPTLAVSRDGVMSVAKAGYSYIIAGDVSLNDYSAKSKAEMEDRLIKGYITDSGYNYNIKSGSVVVLHMSDTSRFTADALDTFLTENAKKPNDKRFRFARLSDYLKQ